MKHQCEANNQGCCQRSITYIEHIIILIVMMILPVHILFMNYLSDGFSWDHVDFIWKTNVVIAAIMFIMLLMYYIFQKPYIAMVFGCHQMSSRSFKIFKRQFVLCARCSGILLGIYIMLFVSRLDIYPLWYLLGFIPIGIDGLLQRFTDYVSTNKKRFFTGILFSPAFIVILSYYYLLIAKFIAVIVNFLIDKLNIVVS